MQLRYLAIILGSLSIGATASTVQHQWCSSGPPSNETVRQLQLAKAGKTAGTLSALRAQGDILDINVYMHGVLDPGQDPKTITEGGMRAQLDVINQAFAPHLIQFTLASMDFTTDARLAHFVAQQNWDDYRRDYVRRSYKGSYDELNIWYYPSAEPPLVGATYLPDVHRRSNKSDWFYDGCHVVGSTMPGGNQEGHAEGFVTVHEMGHWFGLLHPWGHKKNDCGGPGDEVDDTPAQAGPVFGCPASPPDSCEDQPGLDSPDNHMDYADDSCYPTRKFTPGQVDRMYDVYDHIRR